MAYDELLADRIRSALDARQGIAEKKMFGGVAFLLDGKMFCGVAKGELMVRVGPARYADALRQRHARPMDFTGRPMNGYVFVGAPGCGTDKAVRAWVERGVEFVASLTGDGGRGAVKPNAQSASRRRSGSKEVEAWFARYQNPMKAVLLRMREIILAADERIDECIKWQAPTFVFQGNLASFFPKSKQHASLMFHLGASIPGKHPRLEGGGDTSRVMKIGSVAEANAAKRELEQVVRAWCDWRTSLAPNGTATRKAAGEKRSGQKKNAAASRSRPRGKK